jgi:hypothetical protein
LTASSAVPRTFGRFGSGPLVFADYSFGNLDDQSGSGQLVAGSASSRKCVMLC